MSDRLGVLLMTYGSPAADLHDLPRTSPPSAADASPRPSWCTSSGAGTSSSAARR